MAWSRDPKLLLLDEPHAGLDADGRAVLDEIIRAAPGEGRTVLIASHELDRTRALSDREVVLTAGQAALPELPQTAPPQPQSLASKREAAAGVSPDATSERVIG